MNPFALSYRDESSFELMICSDISNPTRYEGVFEWNDEKASELDWFYHLTGGTTHTDFFAVRPTDYSKANEGEDFNDIW